MRLLQLRLGARQGAFLLARPVFCFIFLEANQPLPSPAEEKGLAILPVLGEMDLHDFADHHHMVSGIYAGSDLAFHICESLQNKRGGNPFCPDRRELSFGEFVYEFP